MSKDVKIILIVVGSLVGIVVVAIVGFVVVASLGAFHNLGGATDPRKSAATAAQIVDFRVPAGYRLFSAVDLGFVKMAMVGPVERSKSNFVMQLEGMSIPMTGQTDAEIMRGMQQGMQQGMSVSTKCSSFQTTGSDRIVTETGRTIVLTEMRCTDQGSGRIIEFGRIPAKVPIGVFLAQGYAGGFDHDAVRALLRSIR